MAESEVKHGQVTAFVIVGIIFVIWLGILVWYFSMHDKYGNRFMSDKRKNSDTSTFHKLDTCDEWADKIHKQQEIDFRTGKRSDGRK